MDIDWFYLWAIQYQTYLLQAALEVIEEATADLKEYWETIIAQQAEIAELKLELARARGDESTVHKLELAMELERVRVKILPANQ